jgi:hypothetical protein
LWAATVKWVGSFAGVAAIAEIYSGFVVTNVHLTATIQ